MTAIPHSPKPFLKLYKSDGTPQESGPNGWTLVNGLTYYAEVGGDAASVQSAQFDWDAAAILTITMEDSNWLPDEVSGYATNTRAWTPENPSTGSVGVTGGTSVGLTVTVPGGTAGSCMFHLGNTGALRNRFKILVGATGGNVNGRAHAKG